MRNEVDKEGRQWQQDNEASKDIYKGANGGYVEVVKQQGNERAKNLETYKQMADNGGKYKLLKPTTVVKIKNPDALNLATGMFSDAKHPVGEIGKNAMQSSIYSANKQKVGEVIIRLDREYSTRSLYDGVKAAFHKGRAENIKVMYIIPKGGKPIRFEVEAIRKYFYKK